MKAPHFFEAWIHSVEGVRGGHPRGTFPVAINLMTEQYGPTVGAEAKRYYERLYNDFFGPPPKPSEPVNT